MPGPAPSPCRTPSRLPPKQLSMRPPAQSAGPRLARALAASPGHLPSLCPASLSHPAALPRWMVTNALTTCLYRAQNAPVTSSYSSEKVQSQDTPPCAAHAGPCTHPTSAIPRPAQVALLCAL